MFTLIGILSVTLIITSCLFAFVYGGKTGKTGAIMIIIASVASYTCSNLENWSETHIPMMIIDASLLIGLYYIALYSKSYWPMWSTSFQLITVLTHVTTIFISDYYFRIYFGLANIWSILILVSMVIGITLDKRNNNNMHI